MSNISHYDLIPYRGKSLMQWAIEWFSMSNDGFYRLYGFNFTSHIIILAVLLTLFITAYGIMIWTK